MSEHPPGMVVTFYSFKGGVGRSMALANVAEILADAGYRVVVCDWDLEAPGMERYFVASDTTPFGQNPGIIDLLTEYKQRLSEVRETGGSAPLLEGLTRPSSYARFVNSNRSRGGSVRVLSAGRHNGEGAAAYARAVQNFDWTEFYERWAGGSYLEFFRDELLRDADVVLLDSRTGVTEQGGVCTHHLADLVLLLTAANDLNLRGSLWMAERLSRPELSQFRAGRALRLLPVPARIEQTSQKDELSLFRHRLEDRMKKFVDVNAGDGVAFLRATEIPYIPFYSFQERVAARELDPHRQLLDAYTAIARGIGSVGVHTGLLRMPPVAGWLPAADDASRQPSVEEDTALARRLSAHVLWLQSAGQTGEVASFRGETRRSIDLSERDLQGADFERAAMEDANLRHANLRDARLTAARLKGTDFRDAILDGATLEDADLSGANLQGTSLQRANLRLAKLQNANLGGAHLEAADLTGASLEGATMRACDLRGARLARTRGLTVRQLSAAVLDDTTELPDDLASTIRRDRKPTPESTTSVPAPPGPVCFVSMPFGQKPDRDGRVIDFDQIYELAIRPALEEAGLRSVRGDEEIAGGIIHKSLFERLIASEFVVADLSTANGNVFYNLGIRHALQPRRTVTIFQPGTPLPFDLNYLRMIAYGPSDSSGLSPEAVAELRHRLVSRLAELRRGNAAVDSPVYQLLRLDAPDVRALSAEVDRDRIDYVQLMTARLSEMRVSPSGLAEFDALRPRLGAVHDLPDEVTLKFFEVLRALGGSPQILRLWDEVRPELQSHTDVQLFRIQALVDVGRLSQALDVLNGMSGEGHTDARIDVWKGRVSQELGKEADRQRQSLRARGHLRTAIECYQRAFDADLTSPAPGIQLVALLEAEGSPESRRLRERIIPVVRYVVERRLASMPSYWDLACALNLAVVDNEAAMASDVLARMLSADPERWMLDSTRQAIEDCMRLRHRSGQVPPWYEELLAAMTSPS